MHHYVGVFATGVALLLRGLMLLVLEPLMRLLSLFAVAAILAALNTTEIGIAIACATD